VKLGIYLVDSVFLTFSRKRRVFCLTIEYYFVIIEPFIDELNQGNYKELEFCLINGMISEEQRIEIQEKLLENFLILHKQGR